MISDYKMAIMRKDYATTYEYRQAIRFWRECGREIKRVPGGVQVRGNSFRKDSDK